MIMSLGSAPQRRMMGGNRPVSGSKTKKGHDSEGPKMVGMGFQCPQGSRHDLVLQAFVLSFAMYPFLVTVGRLFTAVGDPWAAAANAPIGLWPQAPPCSSFANWFSYLPGSKPFSRGGAL